VYEGRHCENAAFCLPDVWDWSVLVRYVREV
jgi:hypothetical protein